MTRHWCARLGATLIVLLVLGAAMPSREPRFVADAVCARAPWTAREVALPAGFAATVDRATRDQFVGVVAGDLDDDGDVDVVASLGSLDLAVWRNDGAGHFTRLSSSHHLAFQTQPPAPAVDGDPLGSHEWIPNGDPRDAGSEPRRARAVDDPESPLTATALTVAANVGPRVCSSRAPPLA